MNEFLRVTCSRLVICGTFQAQDNAFPLFCAVLPLYPVSYLSNTYSILLSSNVTASARASKKLPLAKSNTLGSWLWLDKHAFQFIKVEMKYRRFITDHTTAQVSFQTDSQ